MHTITHRLGAVVAASALSVSGLSLIAGPAQAAGNDPRPLTIGADWLAGELDNGLLIGDFGPLYGASIDAALSLKAAGGHASDVAAVGTAIGDDITDYVEYDYSYDSSFPADGIEEHFQGQAAGATAKALVLAQALATPTTTLGGIDLLTRLEGFVATSGPSTGRLIGVSTKDGLDDPDSEYTNVVGQALGVSALNSAGSAKLPAAVDFLLQQQCSAGYFRVDFNADKSATDQTCDGGIPSGTSGADTDATAISLRMLTGIADPSPAVTAAITKATDWLLAGQRADGSFGGGESTSDPNSNSTAAAGLALAAAGREPEAAEAAVWVRRHQVDELTGCPSNVSSQTGAIAYNDAALDHGRENGITPTTRQEWRIAAAQSLPVLALAPSTAPALSISGPSDFVKAGSATTFQVAGVVPGDKVCIVAFGVGRPAAAGADGKVAVRLTLPAGTAERTVSVRDRGLNTAAVQFSVLAAKTLNVAAPSKVRRGAKATVTVRGLKPAEHVVLTYKGAKIRTGVANVNGVFVARFPVGRSLGKKVVRAYGQFYGIRKGADLLKVVR